MPETDKVVALADIFGVTTDYLLRLQLEQTKPEEKQPPPQERKDWVERFLAFSKRKWYLLGWVLIAWGVLIWCSWRCFIWRTGGCWADSRV